MANFDKQVERNIQGKNFEKAGLIDKAIVVYEENVKEGFEGNHPYDRLAIIYRKEKKVNEEIRVLEKAIIVFEKVTKSGRLDGSPKLQKFKDELGKAKEKASDN